MLQNRQVVCSDCKTEFIMETERKQGDIVEVGFECPMCHAWYHGFYTNPKLDRMKTILSRFAEKANRSEKDWRLFRQKKQEFHLAFDKLNPKKNTSLAR